MASACVIMSKTPTTWTGFLESSRWFASGLFESLDAESTHSFILCWLLLLLRLTIIIERRQQQHGNMIATNLMMSSQERVRACTCTLELACELGRRAKADAHCSPGSCEMVSNVVRFLYFPPLAEFVLPSLHVDAACLFVGFGGGLFASSLQLRGRNQTSRRACAVGAQAADCVEPVRNMKNCSCAASPNLPATNYRRTLMRTRCSSCRIIPNEPPSCSPLHTGFRCARNHTTLLVGLQFREREPGKSWRLTDTSGHNKRSRTRARQSELQEQQSVASKTRTTNKNKCISDQ